MALAVGHQMHQQPGSACSPLLWVLQRGVGWTEVVISHDGKPQCRPRLLALGSVHRWRAASCAFAHQRLLSMKQDWQRVPGLSGFDPTYVTDKSGVIKVKIAKENYNSPILPTFSKSQIIAFQDCWKCCGLREVKTTCEMLINKLISWLIRCEI